MGPVVEESVDAMMAGNPEQPDSFNLAVSVPGDIHMLFTPTGILEKQLGRPVRLLSESHDTLVDGSLKGLIEAFRRLDSIQVSSLRFLRRLRIDGPDIVQWRDRTALVVCESVPGGAVSHEDMLPVPVDIIQFNGIAPSKIDGDILCHIMNIDMNLVCINPLRHKSPFE